MNNMEKIKNFVLPENHNRLYREEASSSIALTREVAAKINELVAAYNQLAEEDLRWKQTQEGTIRKGIIYMKDNLVNSLRELLSLYDYSMIREAMLQMYGEELQLLKFVVTPQMFGATGNGITNDRLAIEQAIASLQEGDVLYFPKGTYRIAGRAVEIAKANITFAGEGLILCDYGFRVKASDFKVVGLRFESLAYSQDSRAFVGIRDFEKLGYTVTYTSHKDEFDSFFDYKEVVIEK